ncbi:hypothetical protein PUN28_008646 [Cardiocondyla obscurior]|uniref:Uncharacterized protein n=1 Tax=Cardiocondyla obscurior TaxID=286306 RepID=A0AAW2G4K3_9HYME
MEATQTSCPSRGVRTVHATVEFKFRMASPSGARRTNERGMRTLCRCCRRCRCVPQCKRHFLCPRVKKAAARWAAVTRRGGSGTWPSWRARGAGSSCRGWPSPDDRFLLASTVFLAASECL